MIFVGLGIIAVAIIALIATGDSGHVGGVESNQFAHIAYLAALLVLVTGGFWHRFRDRMSDNVRALAIWAIIGAVVVAGYAYKEQAKGVAGTMFGALRPGTAVTGSDGEVVITRRSDGDFSVYAEINGQAEQRFAFDTGASTVVLTQENAALLGIKPADDAFTAKVATANGTTTAAPIQLDSIAIGPITERRVDAMVSRTGELSTNLLGQSFLERLPSYEVRGDRLVLRSR